MAGFPGSSLTQDTGIIDGGSFIINYDLTVGVNPIPVILLQNSAILQTSTPSTISDMTVDSGSLFVVQSSVLSNIPGATVLVNTDSNIKGTGSSVIDLSEFNLSISGNVEFFDSSIITIDNSFISIPAGCLQQFGNTHLTTNNTFYDAACTLQFHETSSFEAYYSFFDVSGMLDTFDEISFIVNHSDMTIDGMVMFSGSQTSTIQFKSSNFTVNNGEVMFSEEVDPLFENSKFTVNGGSLITNTNTSPSFIGTIVSITGGDVMLEDNTYSIFTNSELHITGGMVMTDNHSYSSFTNTPVNIEGGNLRMGISSQMIFDNSPLTINSESSSMILEDQSNISFSNSKIELVGDLVAEGTSQINILDSSSPIEINGGDLMIKGASQFNAAIGTFIDVKKGNFQSYDNVDLDLIGISLNISGNVEFFNSSIITIDDSFISIPAGCLQQFGCVHSSIS